MNDLVSTLRKELEAGRDSATAIDVATARHGEVSLPEMQRAFARLSDAATRNPDVALIVPLNYRRLRR